MKYFNDELAELYEAVLNEDYSQLISEADFSGKGHGITSKMWMTKSGRILSTGGAFHSQYAVQNKDKLKANFGVDLDGVESPEEEEMRRNYGIWDQKIRVHMIKQGMFRINHEARGNKVTIEGLEKYFNAKVKDSIVRLVEENPWDIAFISIVLMDDTAETVVKTKYANLVLPDERRKIEKIVDVLAESKVVE